MKTIDPSGRSLNKIKEHSTHDKIVEILKKEEKEIIFCGDRKIERLNYNKIASDIMKITNNI